MIEYWFMFPIAIVISTIAMMSGIGGAILFSPFLIFVLHLDPLVAFATGLFIEFFGFSSGIIGYLRQKAIRFDIVKKILPYSLGGTLIGVLIAQHFSATFLLTLLGLLLFYLGYTFLFLPSPEEVAAEGKTNIVLDRVTKSCAALGGLLMGLISSGLGEVDEYLFLERMKLKVNQASGTSVFTIAMSALIGSAAHIFAFSKTSFAVFYTIIPIAVFSALGVVIGAQIGAWLAMKVDRSHMEEFLGVLFGALSIIVLVRTYVSEKVRTNDGSMTYRNTDYDETYHSTSGALEEAQKKFIEPCEIQDGMRILDIGFGLGYNILMAMHAAKNLDIVSLEKDEELLHSLRNIVVPEAFTNDYTKVQVAAESKTYADADCSIQVVIGDATHTLTSLSGPFDAVFLDAFSPKKNPELWTITFFQDVFSLMKPGARLATYSCAGQVRRDLTALGFLVEDGPRVGRRSPSTVAIKPLSGQTL